MLIVMVIVILNFGDDKAKVGWGDNTAVDDGNSNDGCGPNEGGAVDANDNDYNGDNTNTGDDNNDNIADENKNDGDGIEANGGSNDKDDINFEDDCGVKNKFWQFNFVSIFTIFDTNLSFPDSVRCKQSL